MRRPVLPAALLLFAAACAGEPPHLPDDDTALEAWHQTAYHETRADRVQERLVDIRSIDKRILTDIRYATEDNFTGKRIYPADRCLLRVSVAAQLARVQSDLAARGLGLKVWDCYRPYSVQKLLWSIKPDANYVAPPHKGSRHNRGASVDVTLVDAGGGELEMPSGYDDFSEKAHRGWRGASPAALRNRRILEEAMSRRGFFGLRTEWWHFDAEGWKGFPILDVPLDEVP